jgi:hypothetical protein
MRKARKNGHETPRLRNFIYKCHKLFLEPSEWVPCDALTFSFVLFVLFERRGTNALGCASRLKRDGFTPFDRFDLFDFFDPSSCLSSRHRNDNR